jgi:hypothetical protein
MAVHGKCTKITIKKEDGGELDLTPYVSSVDMSLAGSEAEPARKEMPSYEVSFTIGADTEFARAIRQYLRRKWTLAWLVNFANWAFGKN